MSTTYTFDPSIVEDRILAKRFLQLLDEESVLGDVAEPAEGSLDLEAFMQNVGVESWKFISEAMKHFGPDEEFTFEELSAKTGHDVKVLKAWHRNLARTAKYLGSEIGKILPPEWRDGRQHYRITPAAYRRFAAAN